MAVNSVNLVHEEENQSSWAVVRTKPNQERLAMVNLGMRDLQVYCPRILLDRWHTRAPRGPAALFPGYIFVRLTSDLPINRLRYCAGVLYPLVFDNVLAQVECGFIDDLRGLERGRGFITHKELDPGLNPGCRVRVIGGSLNEIEGVFHGFVNGRDRAKIFVEFLRRRTIMEVETVRLVRID